jgi:hypothetical protein
MTEPKKPRKFNPDWPSAKADTPERKAAAQRARYARMKKIAVDAGYSSWSELVTAILNGKVEIPPKPPKS